MTVLGGSAPVARVAIAVLALCLTLPAGVASARVDASVGPVSSSPNVSLSTTGRITSLGVPLVVSWPAASPDAAPVDHYDLERSLDGGPWTPVTLPGPLSRSVVVGTRPWTSVRFRVRAVDTSAVQGDWSESAPRWLSAPQEADPTVQLAGSWQTVSDRRAYLKQRASTTTGGDTATFEFVGREVAWVSRRSPTMGQAAVSADGDAPSSVNLYRSSKQLRAIVFTQTWPTSGEHTLQVTVTSPGLRVDIDAFVVLADVVDGTLVGAGDIAVCVSSWDSATAALVSDVLANNPDAWAFTAGDNTYPDGSPDNFTNCYDPTWGAFKARTHPVIGNHEFYNNPGAAGYFGYFGAAAGYSGRGYYRYDIGTWRVYALTSECKPSSICGQAQLNWLEADLAKEPHACVMAIWHRPVLSTGEHGNSGRMASVFKLLYDNGADLVVGGHDHTYQRFMPVDPTYTVDGGRGIRQFVVGTGGASL
ncbi:MAG: metallophosphoesterase, partial [Candidatus Limnocylindrales bacterium]